MLLDLLPGFTKWNTNLKLAVVKNKAGDNKILDCKVDKFALLYLFVTSYNGVMFAINCQCCAGVWK